MMIRKTLVLPTKVAGIRQCLKIMPYLSNIAGIWVFVLATWFRVLKGLESGQIMAV